jgi:hypothetical protein
MNAWQQLKHWIREVTCLGILLVGLGIVIQVLFGDAIFVTGDIVSNLLEIIERLGEAGFAGLIALVVIIWVLAAAWRQGGAEAPRPAASEGLGGAADTD